MSESEEHRERDALNQTLREVIRCVRTLKAPPETLRRARGALEAVAVELEPHAQAGPYGQAGLGGEPPEPDVHQRPMALFPFSPIIGRWNPLAPPVPMEFAAGAIRGRARFGAPYAGPPGTLHGGVVALVMDELLGTCVTANGVGGFTGTLTVRYLAPTPLGAEVEMAGRLDRSEGRKAFASGRFTVAGRTTAECEGVFVRPREEP